MNMSKNIFKTKSKFKTKTKLKAKISNTRYKLGILLCDLLKIGEPIEAL